MKKLIVANWKMNKTIYESISFVMEFKKLVNDDKNVDIAICPPFTALNAVSSELKKSGIKLGAQNMHFENSGAFTGEISPLMLKDVGCQYVILGHSDRREVGENDSLINKKVISALKHGLTPILCIGESHEQRIKDETQDVLENQLIKCLQDVKEIQKVVFAYEPVWAISKGNPNQKAATKDDAEEAHLFIRKLLAGISDEKSAKDTRIIYGGSMKPENAKELLEMRNIDGGLVGNASLDARSFAEIVRFGGD
ncbi:triose-phosphate isomerase [Candidatus Woesearchaeota archaeon]|nr:triose-phosphate isomerase [Candidatus Woesearchaeota archaeon]